MYMKCFNISNGISNGLDRLGPSTRKKKATLVNTTVQLIEAEWRIYASLDKTIIGSDNGLSPDRRQAIIWTTCWYIAN